ncbi:MAG: PIN domain-containing protein [bacterium]
MDTTIWSLALRRKRTGRRDKALIGELRELVREMRAVLIGPVRQEVLSGIAEEAQFERVREHLAAFDDLAITTSDYEAAARAYNTCRRQGVQGSHVDFLICAVAAQHAAAVFTTDQDFNRYANHLGFALHEPRGG